MLQLCRANVRVCEVWRATVERVAGTLRVDGVRMAAVDCDLERALCDRLQV